MESNGIIEIFQKKIVNFDELIEKKNWETKTL